MRGGTNRTSFAGSKDEMFFESRGWLDSDCEDDFHSVNGGNHIARHALSIL
jgi:hypothetical protein